MLSAQSSSMAEKPLVCCDNLPIFEITYATGDKYFVCKECIKKNYWNRYIRTQNAIKDDV